MFNTILNRSQVDGTAVPSVVSDAMLRVSDKAKDEHEAALLEQAIKNASYTSYVGSYSAFQNYHIFV